MDSLPCLGPVSGTALADVQLRESEVHAELAGAAPPAGGGQRPSTCLLAAVGAQRGGALALMRRSVPADIITAVPGLSAHGAWTLHHMPLVDSSTSDDGDKAAAMADTATPAAAAAADSSTTKCGEQHHAFLLMSCGGTRTMVLDARGPELAELTDDVRALRVFQGGHGRCE